MYSLRLVLFEEELERENTAFLGRVKFRFRGFDACI